MYYHPIGTNGLWATTLAYGLNHSSEIVSGGPFEATTGGGLLESSITLSARHTFFGRGEIGGMPGHHLHAIEYSRSVFIVGKLQFGYVRHLGAAKGLTPGIGGTVALSLVPSELAPRYGGRTAPTFGVFFSLQAARHEM
jgi:hypothetical protein